MSLCSPASPLLAGLAPRAVTFGAGEFLPSTATLRRPGAVDTLERTSDGRVRANHTSDDSGRRVSLAHNLAILRHDGKWLKIGGQDNNRNSGKANVGLWALSADNGWAWRHQTHQRLPSALNVLNGSS